MNIILKTFQILRIGKEFRIYINYLLPNDTDYITLFSNRQFIEINMQESEDKEKIKDELILLNLINRLAIKFSNRQILESNN